MRILVDTSVAIDCLRGNENALRAMRDARLGGAALLISLVSVAEIYAGMYPEERDKTEELLAALSPVGIDEDIAKAAGAHAFEYRTARPKTSIADYLIAATAAAEQADLWTLNIKDFPMLEGLAPPY